MSFAIALSDEQWELVADLFDPPGRRGAPALSLAARWSTRCCSSAAPAASGATCPSATRAWTAVWAQWRRWRANGVWGRAMTRLAAIVRVLHEREPVPSMVMFDAQTVKGGRYGPTFHQAGGPGGRTIGTKRTLLVEILGLPVAAAACSARPHDVAGRPRAAARAHRQPAPPPRVVGDRAYRGLRALAARKRIAPRHQGAAARRRRVHPLWPLYKVEHTIAQLGRWRRLSRCYEGTAASARAWLEVASVGYLAWRVVV